MIKFHVSERVYGWIFGIIAAGLIGSSQLNNLLLKHYSSDKIIRGALYFQNLMGLLLFIVSFTGLLGLYSAIILIFLFLCCQGFVFPNASALSMAPFASNAGNASALMGFIQLSIGALMSALVSFLQNNSALPMTGVMCCCSLSATLLLYIGSRKIKYQANLLLVEEEDVDMVSTF